MTRYLNLSGESNVWGYEIGTAYIRVRFNDGSIYLYTYESAGKFHIENMKQLAVAGQGLNSYINRHVKYSYASKE